MSYTIHGIQHLGVGVPEHAKAWKWYRKFFGLNVPFFNDEAEAELMTIYTEGEVISKRAAMVLNLKGGCAMEIVRPSTFKATHPKKEPQLGDLGIYIGWVKTPDVQKAYDFFKKNKVELISDIIKMPNGWDTFYLKDLNGLIFQIIPSDKFFSKTKDVTGGTAGCTIGVSDMAKAIEFYKILGYDEIVYDETAVFDDWKTINGGESKHRRVLLTQANPSTGGFSQLIGDSYIELVQDLSGRDITKIYEDRKWGDIGFVHLGFDVRNMAAIGEKLATVGHGFTCDTKDVLSMGESTKVHCTYCEDPDGTLIEMIEVYKIPILEKLGVYLNVEKTAHSKPLPKLMLKALNFTKVKD
jgi:catechol 2,3-dioxygenase-like lactoylglutathione lyase family enzyme